MRSGGAHPPSGFLLRTAPSSSSVQGSGMRSGVKRTVLTANEVLNGTPVYISVGSIRPVPETVYCRGDYSSPGILTRPDARVRCPATSLTVGQICTEGWTIQCTSSIQLGATVGFWAQIGLFMYGSNRSVAGSIWHRRPTLIRPSPSFLHCTVSGATLRGLQ